ncbi:hypothetical protein ACIXOK_17055 [Bacteroides fragilis]
MKHEDYIDKINSLTTAVNQFKESYSLLKFSLEASEKRNESLQFQVTRLQDIICIFTDEISGLRVKSSIASAILSAPVLTLLIMRMNICTNPDNIYFLLGVCAGEVQICRRNK